MSIYIQGKQLALKEDVAHPNLLANTTLNADDSKWFSGPGTAQNNVLIRPGILDNPISRYFRFNNADNTGTVGLKNNVYLPTGKYTFSCLVNEGRKANQAGEYFQFKIMATLDSQKKELATINIPTLMDWQRISATFTVSGVMTDITFNVVTGIPNGMMEMTEWKLEYGESATPWCPSIADYYSKLNS